MVHRIGTTTTYVTATQPAASAPAGKSRPSPALPAPTGGLARFGGPYALPLSELALGAWFAVAQVRHLADVIAPGPAQLWRAGGHGGAAWHMLAALAGASAAVHGLVTLGKMLGKR